MSRPLARLAVVLAAVVGLLAVAMSASFGSSETTYLVRPGDTLWSIAQRDGITVAQLAAANDMSPGDLLLAGRTLVVPNASGPGDEATATAAGDGAVAGPTGSLAWACNAGVYGPLGILPAQLAANGGEQLIPVFDHWAAYYGVSPALVEAIAWQESGWQQGVVSGDGAVGVGQLLPATARFVSEDLIGQPLDIYSVDDNIRMEVRFVAYLAAQEDGNLCRTIAAYYEGPANLAAYGVLHQSIQYIADVEAIIPRFE